MRAGRTARALDAVVADAQVRRVRLAGRAGERYGRSEAPMDFRILGPLEVSDGGRAIALGGVKQRSLLAILLQHPNAVVSTDHLRAELWRDAPPASAEKSIHVYVSRLRKALGPD